MTSTSIKRKADYERKKKDRASRNASYAGMTEKSFSSPTAVDLNQASNVLISINRERDENGGKFSSDEESKVYDKAVAVLEGQRPFDHDVVSSSSFGNRFATNANNWTEYSRSFREMDSADRISEFKDMMSSSKAPVETNVQQFDRNLAFSTSDEARALKRIWADVVDKFYQGYNDGNSGQTVYDIIRAISGTVIVDNNSYRFDVDRIKQLAKTGSYEQTRYQARTGVPKKEIISINKNTEIGKEILSKLSNVF